MGAVPVEQRTQGVGERAGQRQVVAPDVRFVHLVGTRTQLADRMRARDGHFMPVSLLDTQLATLEPLGGDEPGIALDCSLDPATLAAHAGRNVAFASLVAPPAGGVDTR